MEIREKDYDELHGVWARMVSGEARNKLGIILDNIRYSTQLIKSSKGDNYSIIISALTKQNKQNQEILDNIKMINGICCRISSNVS